MIPATDIIGVNLMGASGGPNAVQRGARILTKAARTGAAVIFFDEGATADRVIKAQAILGHDWYVHQDTSDLARAGSGIAVRKGVARMPYQRRKLLLGTLPYLNGRRADRMRARFIAQAMLDFGERRKKARAGHVPPARNAFLVPGYLLRLFAGGAIIFADMNLPRWKVRLAARTRRVYQREVMAFAISRRIKVTNVRTVDVGGDHPGLMVTLWIR